jgi:hypothetical protein
LRQHGEPVLMPRVTIVDADKISDEAAAAVAEVSQTVNGALRVANLYANVLQVDRPERLRECFGMLTDRSARCSPVLSP